MIIGQLFERWLACAEIIGYASVASADGLEEATICLAAIHHQLLEQAAPAVDPLEIRLLILKATNASNARLAATKQQLQVVSAVVIVAIIIETNTTMDCCATHESA